MQAWIFSSMYLEISFFLHNIIREVLRKVHLVIKKPGWVMTWATDFQKMDIHTIIHPPTC